MLPWRKKNRIISPTPCKDEWRVTSNASRPHFSGGQKKLRAEVSSNGTSCRDLFCGQALNSRPGIGATALAEVTSWPRRKGGFVEEHPVETMVTATLHQTSQPEITLTCIGSRIFRQK